VLVITVPWVYRPPRKLRPTTRATPWGTSG